MIVATSGLRLTKNNNLSRCFLAAKNRNALIRRTLPEIYAWSSGRTQTGVDTLSESESEIWGKTSKIYLDIYYKLLPFLFRGEVKWYFNQNQ